MFKWSPANDKYLAFAKSTLSVFVSVLKTPSDCSPPFEIRLICQLTVFKNDNDLFCLSRFTRPIYTFCQLLIGNCHEKWLNMMWSRINISASAQINFFSQDKLKSQKLGLCFDLQFILCFTGKGFLSQTIQ